MIVIYQLITSIQLGGAENVAFQLAEHCKAGTSNNFKFTVVELYKTNNEYAKEIKAFIQEMMKPEFYSTFSHLKNDPEYPNNKKHELLDALINRDAERVYAYCRKIHKQNCMKRWSNKILHSILYPFQR